MAQVLDYSAGKPGALAIARAGYRGAVRYIGFPNRTKCTTAGELEDFSRNGLGMALVFEDTNSNWLGGYNQGKADARTARAHADAIGFPRGCPIYMAVDRDVSGASQLATAVAYVQGSADYLGGPGHTGVYGEHDVVAAVAAAGAAKYLWQCRAWSGTPVKLYAGRHLYQQVGTVTVGGIACDINDVLQEDWGQHNAQGGGWLMALTDEQQQQLYTWVKDLTTVLGKYYSLRRDNVGDADDHTIGAAIYDIEFVLGDAWKETVSVEAGNQGVSIGKQVATLYKRPAATVKLDEQAVAAVTAQLLQGLADKNIGGATPEQVTEIVRGAFARGGQA
jgi:hypothetical protein